MASFSWIAAAAILHKCDHAEHGWDIRLFELCALVRTSGLEVAMAVIWFKGLDWVESTESRMAREASWDVIAASKKDAQIG